MIYKKRERALIAAVTLDLHKAWIKTYFNTDAFASHADEFLLCLAILIGQVEGRPLNATKLSAIAGLPRVTVIRKLRSLLERGIVSRTESGGYSITLGTLNSAASRASVDASIKKLEGLYSQLSKMNARPVA